MTQKADKTRVLRAVENSGGEGLCVLKWILHGNIKPQKYTSRSNIFCNFDSLVVFGSFRPFFKLFEIFEKF